jgi:hypothetical protein
MTKKPSEPRARDSAAPSSDDKPAQALKDREQSEKDAVARAVLEALRAHDSM